MNRQDTQITDDGLEQVRRLLDALVAVDDLPAEAAGHFQLAAANLIDPSVQPLPLAPQPPSTDVGADVRAALEILDHEITVAVPATLSIRLAYAARHLRDAETFLNPSVPPDAGGRPEPGTEQ